MESQVGEGVDVAGDGVCVPAVEVVGGEEWVVGRR